MSSLKFKVPSLTELRVKVKEVFGFRPCLSQAKDAIAQLERKDVIMIAPTGFGKTLTFWMPLLFNNDGIVIVVTTLNILGDQNIQELKRLGFKAINITGDTATAANFKVCDIRQYFRTELIIADADGAAKYNQIYLFCQSLGCVNSLTTF